MSRSYSVAAAPRRYLDWVAPELIPPFERNNPCWCSSGRKYKTCHGRGPSSAPGAPVPPDDDDGYWVSPTVRIQRGALRVSDAFAGDGVPITMQDQTHPVAGPLIVPRYGAVLAAAGPAGHHERIGDCGMRRFEILADYGLDHAPSLTAQLKALSDDALAEIAIELLHDARLILDILAANSRREEPLSTLWTEAASVTTMVGQTMLWADLYLTSDRLLDAFLEREAPDRDALRSALVEALELRPLVEAGVVVQVPAGAAVVLASGAIRRSTAADLQSQRLIEWLNGQLVIEGPTAREVVFVHARDDDAEGFYTHSRMDEFSDDGTFKMGLLRRFDAGFDYEPWLRTVRSQFTARLTQELNTDISIARLFGGEYVTRSPFRARFAHQRSVANSAPAIAASIHVPWLPAADANTLARIAAQDEAVQDLRRRVARAIKSVTDTSVAQAALSDLTKEIAEDAVGPLARRLQRVGTWKIAVPGACAMGTIVLGATTGPLGAVVGAALGLGGWASSAFADYKEPRTEAAYVFWAAQSRRGPRSGPRK